MTRSTIAISFCMAHFEGGTGEDGINVFSMELQEIPKTFVKHQLCESFVGVLSIVKGKVMTYKAHNLELNSLSPKYRSTNKVFGRARTLPFHFLIP